MSSKTIVPSIESASALVTPPANPNTVMPAASPAVTPETLSSITAQRSGDASILWAAKRKISGAGFPCATSSTLKIRPSNRSKSPVLPKVNQSCRDSHLKPRTWGS